MFSTAPAPRRVGTHAASNITKTVVLLASIGGLLVAVGQLLGGGSGAVIGLVLGLVVVGGSYWFSDRLALRSAHAHPVEPGDVRGLHELVDDLSRRAGIPMPRLYLSESPQPNAFATGRNPKNAAVVLTTGLLQVCSADEVRGVVAHELAHIKHRDILIGSIAAAVATGISFVANMAMWQGMFGGGDDEDRPNPALMLLVALVAPIAATILQMALSRAREFEADRGGAEILGDPEPLARALARIDAIANRTPMDVTPAQSGAYIVNPLTGRRRDMARLFLTHPPVEDRIARLRVLAPVR